MIAWTRARAARARLTAVEARMLRGRPTGAALQNAEQAFLEAVLLDVAAADLDDLGEDVQDLLVHAAGRLKLVAAAPREALSALVVAQEEGRDLRPAYSHLAALYARAEVA